MTLAPNGACADERTRSEGGVTRLPAGTDDAGRQARCPHEFENRAADERLRDVKARLARFLPAGDAPDVPEVNPDKDGSRWQEEAFTGAD